MWMWMLYLKLVAVVISVQLWNWSKIRAAHISSSCLHVGVAELPLASFFFSLWEPGQHLPWHRSVVLRWLRGWRGQEQGSDAYRPIITYLRQWSTLKWQGIYPGQMWASESKGTLKGTGCCALFVLNQEPRKAVKTWLPVTCTHSWWPPGFFLLLLFFKHRMTGFIK